jgi:hypothetical protein
MQSHSTVIDLGGSTGGAYREFLFDHPAEIPMQVMVKLKEMITALQDWSLH